MHIEYFTWVFMIQKRFSLSFQRVKLRVEFPIWIWYSKIIIELFKTFLLSLWVLWDFKSFQAKLEFMRFIELKSFKVWCLFSHEICGLESWELCDLWVVRWAIPMRRMSWVMSYQYFELWVIITWVWVIITMHCFESFRGICWHSTESIIRWDP